MKAEQFLIFNPSTVPRTSKVTERVPLQQALPCEAEKPRCLSAVCVTRVGGPTHGHEVSRQDPCRVLDDKRTSEKKSDECVCVLRTGCPTWARKCVITARGSFPFLFADWQRRRHPCCIPHMRSETRNLVPNDLADDFGGNPQRRNNLH